MTDLDTQTAANKAAAHELRGIIMCGIGLLSVFAGLAEALAWGRPAGVAALFFGVGIMAGALSMMDWTARAAKEEGI